MMLSVKRIISHLVDALSLFPRGIDDDCDALWGTHSCQPRGSLWTHWEVSDDACH